MKRTLWSLDKLAFTIRFFPPEKRNASPDVKNIRQYLTNRWYYTTKGRQQIEQILELIANRDTETVKEVVANALESTKNEMNTKYLDQESYYRMKDTIKTLSWIVNWFKSGNVNLAKNSLSNVERSLESGSSRYTEQHRQALGSVINLIKNQQYEEAIEMMQDLRRRKPRISYRSATSRAKREMVC